jgi:hypothetical protein
MSWGPSATPAMARGSASRRPGVPKAAGGAKGRARYSAPKEIASEAPHAPQIASRERRDKDRHGNAADQRSNARRPPKTVLRVKGALVSNVCADGGATRQGGRRSQLWFELKPTEIEADRKAILTLGGPAPAAAVRAHQASRLWSPETPPLTRVHGALSVLFHTRAWPEAAWSLRLWGGSSGEKLPVFAHPFPAVDIISANALCSVPQT